MYVFCICNLIYWFVFIIFNSSDFNRFFPHHAGNTSGNPVQQMLFCYFREPNDRGIMDVLGKYGGVAWYNGCGFLLLGLWHPHCPLSHSYADIVLMVYYWQCDCYTPLQMLQCQSWYVIRSKHYTKVCF